MLTNQTGRDSGRHHARRIQVAKAACLGIRRSQTTPLGVLLELDYVM